MWHRREHVNHISLVLLFSYSNQIWTKSIWISIQQLWNILNTKVCRHTMKERILFWFLPVNTVHGSWMRPFWTVCFRWSGRGKKQNSFGWDRKWWNSFFVIGSSSFRWRSIQIELMKQMVQSLLSARTQPTMNSIECSKIEPQTPTPNDEYGK